MLAGVIVADVYSDPHVSENNFEISSCVVCPSGCSDYWNNAVQAAVRLYRLEDFIYGLMQPSFYPREVQVNMFAVFQRFVFPGVFVPSHIDTSRFLTFFPHRSSWGLSALHKGTSRVVAEEKGERY